MSRKDHRKQKIQLGLEEWGKVEIKRCMHLNRYTNDKEMPNIIHHHPQLFPINLLLVKQTTQVAEMVIKYGLIFIYYSFILFLS